MFTNKSCGRAIGTRRFFQAMEILYEHINFTGLSEWRKYWARFYVNEDWADNASSYLSRSRSKRLYKSRAIQLLTCLPRAGKLCSRAAQIPSAPNNPSLPLLQLPTFCAGRPAEVCTGFASPQGSGAVRAEESGNYRGAAPNGEPLSRPLAMCSDSGAPRCVRARAGPRRFRSTPLIESAACFHGSQWAMRRLCCRLIRASYWPLSVTSGRSGLPLWQAVAMLLHRNAHYVNSDRSRGRHWGVARSETRGRWGARLARLQLRWLRSKPASDHRQDLVAIFQLSKSW